MKFPVETSARHLHISKEDLAILFGAGVELTNKKELSQPGQYATNERVTVVGPKGQLVMTILGPVRPTTQVEISLSDARTLGVQAPIRESGDTQGSAPCKLIGPCGEVELSQGVIVAKRHLHTTPEDAVKLGVSDKEIISIKVESPDRTTIFGDVVVRVSPKFATAVHLDTDEANAAACSVNATGEKL